MTHSTEAQDRFERILRRQAEMADTQAAIAAKDPHYQRVSDPLDSARLRRLADEFRTTFIDRELTALETWDEEYMNILAVAIGHGAPLRPYGAPQTMLR